MADPEIEAISAIATALTDLDDGARARVLHWAAERYGVQLSSDGRRSAATSDDNDTPVREVTEDQIKAEAPTFEHFAELFAATQPKTNEDKALVAAYWVQVIQGQDKWQSPTLNTELKNLGHAIPNITDALTSNIEKKPQRVIQLQKAGTSRQARKTYKVTHEGLVYVAGMLGHGA
jgi:hypothetical protein